MQFIDVCEKKENLFFMKRNISTHLSYKSFILLEYIKATKPPWAQYFLRGIDYLKNIEKRKKNIGVYQSLGEIGLFKENLEEDSKNFLYEIKKFLYSSHNQNHNLDIGRKGEECSYFYELNKTGNTPRHESLYDEWAGYDLISYLPSGQKKHIEVKASTYNQAYITWNEWKVARATILRNELYEFHLWKKESNKWMLAIIQPNELSFLGEEVRDGHHWKDYLIQFFPFKDKFVEITSNQLKK